MIYILYGQPASGKTTLGAMLAEHLDTPFVIDGDEFREMFTNKNYGRGGREENIRNAIGKGCPDKSSKHVGYKL